VLYIVVTRASILWHCSARFKCTIWSGMWWLFFYLLYARYFLRMYCVNRFRL